MTPPTSPPRPRRRKPHQRLLDWLYTWAFPNLFAWVLKTIFLTLRVEIRGREHLAPFWDEGQPVIVGCWHGRLLFIPWAWQRVGRGDVYVLMGRNRNGELITRIVAHFNMKAIRGGTSKGGEQARQEMLAAVERSPRTTLAMTPDGPRGPRYESKMGMAWASRALGIPVIWVTASAAWNWRVPTWDRFMVPVPFSRVVVEFGPPTRPEDHGELDMEAWRELLDEVARRQVLALDRELGVVAADDLPLLDPAAD